jgi:hypothetical protein
MYHKGLVLNNDIPSWKIARRVFSDGIMMPRFLRDLTSQIYDLVDSVLPSLSALANARKSLSTSSSRISPSISS